MCGLALTPTPLSPLQSVGGLALLFHQGLTSTQGLTNLTILDHLVLAYCPALQTLDGMDGVQALSSDMWLQGMNNLTSLAGLQVRVCVCVGGGGHGGEG